MLIIRNPSRDPYFNLASEQYLLDNVENDVFMLWINSPSVIIGRNQNAYSELNVPFIEQNGIKAVRRLTGGGAVFHDCGNVNFTFIKKAEKDTALNFEMFTLPVINAIKALGGDDACLSGRNDVMLKGRKVSGNAQTVRNGKVLHHGTLLYSADFSKMEGALKVDAEKMKSKGIKSVRSRVGNIKELLGCDFSPEEFLSFIEKFVSKGGEHEIREFSPDEIKQIDKLAKERYSTWEWNFGASKEFGFKSGKRFPFGRVEVSVSTDRGMITDIAFSGDFFGKKSVSELEKSLTGVKYDRSEIVRILKKCGAGDYISGADENTVADLIVI